MKRYLLIIKILVPIIALSYLAFIWGAARQNYHPYLHHLRNSGHCLRQPHTRDTRVVGQGHIADKARGWKHHVLGWRTSHEQNLSYCFWSFAGQRGTSSG